MPPAAAYIDCSYSVEEPFDGIADVGGIEVQAIVDDSDAWSVRTKITVTPRDHSGEEAKAVRSGATRGRPPSSPTKSPYQYAYLGSARPDKCLADSFDSLDEIEEGSNEAKLIKSIAEKAEVSSISGASTDSQDPYFPEDTASKYLDVLDRHIEVTDPRSTTFKALDYDPDDPHPSKNQATVDDIIEHLLDAPCCECATEAVKPLKSILRPSKRKFRGAGEPVQSDDETAEGERARTVHFKQVDIREFQMTLGNHPSAASGPPVMLDWDVKSDPEIMDLETYERGRQPRRSRRQLKLSLQQRHLILVKQRGFSFEEVKGAWQEALEIRKQRKETLERGLALMKWDEVWESTCRKFNRLVDGTI